MGNHKQHVKLIWCEKKWHLGFAKGNESRHSAICFSLRIMIFKVYRCKFGELDGDFLKWVLKLRSDSRLEKFRTTFLKLW